MHQNLRFKNPILPSTLMILISAFPDPSLPRLPQSSSQCSNLPLFHLLSNKFKLKSLPLLTPPSTKTSSSTETRKPSHILLESPVTTLNTVKVPNSPPTTSSRCQSSDISSTRTLLLHPNIPQLPCQLEMLLDNPPKDSFPSIPSTPSWKPDSPPKTLSILPTFSQNWTSLLPLITSESLFQKFLPNTDLVKLLESQENSSPKKVNSLLPQQITLLIST